MAVELEAEACNRPYAADLYLAAVERSPDLCSRRKLLAFVLGCLGDLPGGVRGRCNAGECDGRDEEGAGPVRGLGVCRAGSRLLVVRSVGCVAAPFHGLGQLRACAELAQARLGESGCLEDHRDLAPRLARRSSPPLPSRSPGLRAHRRSRAEPPSWSCSRSSVALLRLVTARSSTERHALSGPAGVWRPGR